MAGMTRQEEDEQGERMTVIDITPEGVKTPEGRERVNKAIAANHDALLRGSQALRTLMDALKADGYYTNYRNRDGEVQEAMREGEDALAHWSETGEAMCLAIAGR
jgi:hypothetical protein